MGRELLLIDTVYLIHIKTPKTTRSIKPTMPVSSIACAYSFSAWEAIAVEAESVRVEVAERADQVGLAVDIHGVFA